MHQNEQKKEKTNSKIHQDSVTFKKSSLAFTWLWAATLQRDNTSVFGHLDMSKYILVSSHCLRVNVISCSYTSPYSGDLTCYHGVSPKKTSTKNGYHRSTCDFDIQQSELAPTICLHLNDAVHDNDFIHCCRIAAKWQKLPRRDNEVLSLTLMLVSLSKTFKVNKIYLR